MQAPVVQNGKKTFTEALDKIKEDYNRIEAQTVSQRSELERLNMEKMQVAQQQMMVHQLGFTTNMELQKQTEAAQRLTSLLHSVLQYASPELQATTKLTLERAQQISGPELLQLSSAQQQQQAQQMQQMQQLQMMGMGGAMGGMGGMAGMNGAMGGGGLLMPGGLAVPNGMNMMAMNGAMGGMPQMATPNGTPARAHSVKREQRSSSRATIPEKKPKIENGDSDEEIDVTSHHGERESSVFSDISSASTLPRSESFMKGGDQLQFPMSQFNPAMSMNGMMPVPNGKTVSSFRYDAAGNVSPTVFPPDVLTDPAVPKSLEPLHVLPHGEVVCAVAITRDAQRVLTGGKGCVKIWDLAESTRTERATFRCGTDNYVRSLKINQTGTQLAVAGEFPAVMLFDIETQRQIVSLETGTTACYAIAVDNESKLLYACCENGTVVIFDLVSMREVSRLIGHKEGISCLELSKDGQHLWTGGLDHTLRTWNTRERREESRRDFQSQVFAVGRSPVDEWLAVGLDGKQVEVVSTLPGAKERYSLLGHSSCVLSLRYAHSGRWFCSTGKDDLLNLWTSPHGALAVQKKDDSAVLCCEIAQDDSLMVTGSKGKATVYEVLYGNS